MRLLDKQWASAQPGVKMVPFQEKTVVKVTQFCLKKKKEKAFRPFGLIL